MIDLPFPKSLPDFQRLFPDDAACGRYLEGCRWPGGFACPSCGVVAEPFRFAARPGVLRWPTPRPCVAARAWAPSARASTPSETFEPAEYVVLNVKTEIA